MTDQEYEIQQKRCAIYTELESRKKKNIAQLQKLELDLITICRRNGSKGCTCCEGKFPILSKNIERRFVALIQSICFDQKQDMEKNFAEEFAKI